MTIENTVLIVLCKKLTFPSRS